MSDSKRVFLIRGMLWGFIVGLAISGVTAFPVTTELAALSRWMGISLNASPSSYEGLTRWILTIRDATSNTQAHYPFLFYGYDWLAFAHLIIAVLFIGPIKDPVRNKWVILWGMIACVSIFPLAFIAGGIRGIPFGWQLIDCSFGVVGFFPLLWVYRQISILEKSA